MPSRARQDPQPNMMVYLQIGQHYKPGLLNAQHSTARSATKHDGLPTDRTTLQARSAECPAQHCKIRNQTWFTYR